MGQADDELPKDRLVQPTTAKWFAVIAGFCLLYAILRYHLAGDVDWRHFPLFITNKATALASVMLVASSYLIGHLFRWHDDDKALRLVVIKFCGLMGFSLAAMHAVMSLLILRPGYLAKYFDEAGQLNFAGELGMVLGVIALFFLVMPTLSTLPMMPKALGGKRWKRAQRMGYLSLTLTLAHLIVLGWQGWVKPASWPGAIPPISLLAAIVVIAPLVVKRRRVKEAS